MVYVFKVVYIIFFYYKIYVKFYYRKRMIIFEVLFKIELF